MDFNIPVKRRQIQPSVAAQSFIFRLDYVTAVCVCLCECVYPWFIRVICQPNPIKPSHVERDQTKKFGTAILKTKLEVH